MTILNNKFDYSLYSSQTKRESVLFSDDMTAVYNLLSEAQAQKLQIEKSVMLTAIQEIRLSIALFTI